MRFGLDDLVPGRHWGFGRPRVISRTQERPELESVFNRADASARHRRGTKWVRHRQGELVGLHQGIGMTSGMISTYAPYAIGEVYAIPPAHALSLTFAAWIVGGISLLGINAVFGKSLGTTFALMVGMLASVSLMMIAVAPESTKALFALYGVSGALISSSAIFQAALTRHPLPFVQDQLRLAATQTWASIARAWLPIAVAVAVALLGWRPAVVVLGAAFAGLTFLSWLSLQGGELHAAEGRGLIFHAARRLRQAISHAFGSPNALLRFALSPPLLAFAIGVPIGWMLGAIAPLLAAHLPWLAPLDVVWAAAIVTFIHRYAAAWANRNWVAALVRRGRANTLRTTTSTMILTPLLIVLLCAWPHESTSIIPLVAVFIAVSIAFQLPLVPALAFTRGVGGVSRFFVGTQLGAACGIGAVVFVLEELPSSSLARSAPFGGIQLLESVLGLGYAAMTATTMALAFWITRIKIGPITELERALAELAGRRTSAQIAEALEEAGVHNLGDLVSRSSAQLLSSVGSHHHMLLLNAALDRLALRRAE